MKRIVTLILLLSFFHVPVIYAAENSAGSMSVWDQLRKKIESFTPKKKLGATNAVGGVRGAPSDANDIYWKGEATNETIEADELAAFKNAMELVAAGNTKQAQEGFTDFIKKYPNSSLRKDADQALAALAK